MKTTCRLFLSIVCVALLFGSLYSQDEKENYVGFKGGVSIPQLSSGDDNILSRDFKSRLAPNFGAFFEAGITDKFSVQIEVNYAGQGGKRVGVQPITEPLPGLPPLPDGSFYFGDFKNIAELNSLEVPVLAKYRFGSKGKTRVFVNGGIFYGRLLTAKTITSGSSTIFLDPNGQNPLLLPPNYDPIPPINFDATTDIKDDVNKNNFGFTGGGGVEIPHKNNYFIIEARVSRGVITIQRDTVRNGSSQTGNLVISVGYAFNLD